MKFIWKHFVILSQKGVKREKKKRRIIVQIRPNLTPDQTQTKPRVSFWGLLGSLQGNFGFILRLLLGFSVRTEV